jgi:hypothetical protein
MKRLLLAVLAVFVAWQVMDLLLHNVLMMKTYQETASLWRPMNEMKFGLMRLVGLVMAAGFVVIYAGLVHTRSALTGLKYGVLFGVCSGAGMGFGTYCVMPIPFSLAIGWFAGSVVKGAVGGWIAGGIVKDAATKPASRGR